VNYFLRLRFDLWYLRRPPWDTGIVPPEVEAFIREASPGHALDLGCGTGTSSLALARAGWSVTGVDFARGAIRLATKKARLANLSVDFQVVDVTRLPAALFSIPCDLVLDIGCFHGLSATSKVAYIDQLERLLAPGGFWLIYGFLKPDENPSPGLSPSDLENIHLKLTKRRDGFERKTRPSAWFWFKKE
jgi:SAM-dependent methyltransferase